MRRTECVSKVQLSNLVVQRYESLKVVVPHPTFLLPGRVTLQVSGREVFASLSLEEKDEQVSTVNVEISSLSKAQREMLPSDIISVWHVYVHDQASARIHVIRSRGLKDPSGTDRTMSTWRAQAQSRVPVNWHTHIVTSYVTVQAKLV